MNHGFLGAVPSHQVKTYWGIFYGDHFYMEELLKYLMAVVARGVPRPMGGLVLQVTPLHPQKHDQPSLSQATLQELERRQCSSAAGHHSREVFSH